ncbi:IS66-like element accessory protein TnpA [Magnetospirillum sulfuroxidans]|uniref:Transposase n=1 Tax=Magnetospirillum sulfuroxidans TaxID=611300 RepID=A0ABS5ID67_9PROT|nr:transposase [Magnetospirillum sulfuroxidans]
MVCTDAKGEAMGQVHVLTGPVRRRIWLPEEKAALVGAAFAPGAVVADVARRADVNASLLYRWRRELRVGSAAFTEVVVAPDIGSVVETPGGAAIEVRLADGAQLRIPVSASPDLAAAVIQAAAGR